MSHDIVGAAFFVSCKISTTVNCIFKTGFGDENDLGKYFLTSKYLVVVAFYDPSISIDLTPIYATNLIYGTGFDKIERITEVQNSYTGRKCLKF